MITKYHRIIIKLSGEYLGGDKGMGFDFSVIKELTNQIKEIHSLGVEIALVLGGGNFFRGTRNVPIKMDRVEADHIGMLATVMNSICLKEALISEQMKSEVMTGLDAPGVAKHFDKREALSLLKDGNIMVFGGGTGNPYFSTDTAAVLRGLEIDVDIVIKGTKVDGVYDKDPMIHTTAKKFKKLTFSEVLEKDLKVMDGSAIALCRDNDLRLSVLSLSNQKDLINFICGENTGTIVQNTF